MAAETDQLWEDRLQEARQLLDAHLRDKFAPLLAEAVKALRDGGAP